MYILSMRDVSVRYKQTALGMAWGLIRPLTTMMIMVFVFSRIAKLPGDPGVPYPLMVLGGITVWTFFATAFTQISNSVLLNSNLVTKVYFPRLIMPISAVAVSFIDFLVSLGLFILLSIWYQFIPDWHLLFVPLFMVLAVLAAFASVAVAAAENHERAEQLQQGLESNREIGKAIGLLMAAHKVSADEAFQLLRTTSSQMNIKLAKIAARIVAQGA